MSTQDFVAYVRDNPRVSLLQLMGFIMMITGIAWAVFG